MGGLLDFKDVCHAMTIVALVIAVRALMRDIV